MEDLGLPKINWWKAAGVLVLIIVLFTILSTALGWFSGTASLVGFNHTKEQTTQVLDDWNKLQVAACNAKDVQSTATSSNDPTLVEDPALAYKATYRRIEANYDREMNNFFEAKLTRGIPIPGGISSLPERAPTLSEAEHNC